MSHPLSHCLHACDCQRLLTCACTKFCCFVHGSSLQAIHRTPRGWLRCVYELVNLHGNGSEQQLLQACHFWPGATSICALFASQPTGGIPAACWVCREAHLLQRLLFAGSMDCSWLYGLFIDPATQPQHGVA